MTPAIGQLPMKPMTMRRFFFMIKKTPNAQRRTPNLELGGSSFFAELLCDYGGISGDDDICWDAFRDDGAGGDDGIFANRYAFEDYGVHTDPDVVGNDDGRGA